jgi:hypothetical protein
LFWLNKRRRAICPKKFVPFVAAPLTGGRNGKKIGKKLNIAVKDVVEIKISYE